MRKRQEKRMAIEEGVLSQHMCTQEWVHEAEAAAEAAAYDLILAWCEDDDLLLEWHEEEYSRVSRELASTLAAALPAARNRARRPYQSEAAKVAAILRAQLQAPKDGRSLRGLLP